MINGKVKAQSRLNMFKNVQKIWTCTTTYVHHRLKYRSVTNYWNKQKYGNTCEFYAYYTAKLDVLFEYTNKACSKKTRPKCVLLTQRYSLERKGKLWPLANRNTLRASYHLHAYVKPTIDISSNHFSFSKSSIL